MALTEKTTIDRIEVLEDGFIQIRQATVIEKDGTELTRTFHRWTLTPGQDVSDQAARVKAVATAVWTKDVVDAYLAKQAQSQAAPAAAS